MFSVNQHWGARPVSTLLQSTDLLDNGEDGVAALGRRGEAEVVDERRVVAANARSLGE